MAYTALAHAEPERRDVYRTALEFLALTSQLPLRRGFGDLRDRLDRAGTAIVLNAGEGLGRAAGPDRTRFLVIARVSALECAAVVEVLRVRGLADTGLCDQARSLLDRVTQTLSQLIARDGPPDAGEAVGMREHR